MNTLNHGEESITKMPAFNKTIQVEVNMDTINAKLLDLLPADYKHREVLSHAIIGASAENGGIGYIFAALNGYTNDIDFKVGDMVICSQKDSIEWYDANKENADGTLVDGWIPDEGEANYKPNWKARSVAIGECRVAEVNLYATRKLGVEFEAPSPYRYDGNKQFRTAIVSHLSCQKVPLEEKY